MRLATFVALGVFVASGASSAQAPKNSEQPITTQRSTDAQEAANTIARAIRDTIQPAPQDEGCQDRKDKRESDLCAQWKATDAARDAADYAWWSLLLGIAGTALLYVTLRETRLTARRQLRAYVSVKLVATAIVFRSDKSLRVTPEIIAHNGGSTPAYDCVHFATRLSP